MAVMTRFWATKCWCQTLRSGDDQVICALIGSRDKPLSVLQYGRKFRQVQRRKVCEPFPNSALPNRPRRRSQKNPTGQGRWGSEVLLVTFRQPERSPHSIVSGSRCHSFLGIGYGKVLPRYLTAIGLVILCTPLAFFEIRAVQT